MTCDVGIGLLPASANRRVLPLAGTVVGPEIAADALEAAVDLVHILDIRSCS